MNPLFPLQFILFSFLFQIFDLFMYRPILRVHKYDQPQIIHRILKLVQFNVSPGSCHQSSLIFVIFRVDQDEVAPFYNFQILFIHQCYFQCFQGDSLRICLDHRDCWFFRNFILFFIFCTFLLLECFYKIFWSDFGNCWLIMFEGFLIILSLKLKVALWRTIDDFAINQLKFLWFISWELTNGIDGKIDHQCWIWWNGSSSEISIPEFTTNF